MIGVAAPAGSRAGLLMAGVTAAMMLRVAVGGNEGVQSAPAGLTFAAALLCLALVGGWTPGRAHLRHVGWGIAGSVVLVAVPAWLRWSGAVLPLSLPVDQFPFWAVIVSLVAVSEEVVLRGVLFTAIEQSSGPLIAAGITATAFALLHVPMYGWGALPLDLAVGLWLGGLRLLTGGATAPAVAHTLADLAGWWLV